MLTSIKFSKPSLAAAVALLLVPALALATAPPRGRRTARPKATHVVLTETAFVTGGGPASLLPGVPVSVAGGGGASPKGKTRVTVVWAGLEFDGTIDGTRLGACVNADVPLLSADGKTTIGQARAGGLVRVLGNGTKPGLALVEAAGARFTIKAQLPKEALGAQPFDVVIAHEWNFATAKPTVVYATQALTGSGFARLPEGVQVEAYEQAGDTVHLRTIGGIELDGWTPASNLSPRETQGTPAPDASLIKPTHEVFVDAPVFADAAGKRRIGTLRGGALVEVNAKASINDDIAVKAGTFKIMTPSPVVVEAWVKKVDVRQLSGQGEKPL
jgi:hypothetical protein